MKIYSTIYKLVFFTALFITANYCRAQFPGVKAVTDKSEILIGEQLRLSVEATVVDDFTVGLPQLPDSIAHFEIVEKPKADSIYSEGKLSVIRQDFVLTSFDSGKWVIPAAKITVIPNDKASAGVFYTDSFPVTVSFSQSDTTAQIKDIKPLREAVIKVNYWYWAAAALGLIVIVALIIWWFKSRKRKPAGLLDAKEPPYEEAMKQLKILSRVPLDNPAAIKDFHTQLADIFRRYISRKSNKLHYDKTTGDILMMLSRWNLNKLAIAAAASGLRCSDAVKFAKYLPPENENRECLQSIADAIDALEKLLTAPLNSQ